MLQINLNLSTEYEMHEIRASGRATRLHVLHDPGGQPANFSAEMAQLAPDKVADF
jgi:hypothetical protein